MPAFPIRTINERYEADLLWKGAERPIDNIVQAKATLDSLTRKLKRENIKERYEQTLTEYLELDATEKEPQPEEDGYYLSHHSVVRESSATTKSRIVFNASAARTGQQSLNYLIDPGQSLVPDLAAF